MGWKSNILRPYASYVNRTIQFDTRNAVQLQMDWLTQNVHFAQDTAFGKDHDFESIRSYKDYKAKVPIRTYPELKSYIERFLSGEADVLWPGKPKYIVGTAGTTAGIKHIPLSKESMPFHLKAAINAGINYAYQNGIMDMFDGQLIFLTGSPELGKIGSIPTGRLSGIVNHEIPGWLKKSQVPSYEANAIPDWNQKIDRIVEETKDSDLRMISGIPPWVIMYLEKLLERTGKNQIIDVFPNLRMLIHGGVNYKPYDSIFQKLIGKDIHYLETYPSTEAFVAFQDQNPEDGLLLNANGGCFFEFVPFQEIHSENPTRLSLAEVEVDKTYALIINNNAGLWGSIIGDTVKFVSLDPYRLVHTGRIGQFLSSSGEHILASDVEAALSRAIMQSEARVKEFTVAPLINADINRHQWYIEFDALPKDLDAFGSLLDKEMQKQNFHYKDLVSGQIISPLEVLHLPKGSFEKYLKKQGKLGGQNKVPRLANNRSIVEGLSLILQKNASLG